MQQIRDWLNGNRDFYYGIILLAQHNTDVATVKFFKDIGPNSRTTKKMHSLLLSMYEDLRETTDPVLVDASDRGVAPVVTSTKAAGSRRDTMPCVSLPTTTPATTYEQSPTYLTARQTANLFYKNVMNDRAILFNHCKVENWEDVNQPILVQLRSKAAVKIITDYQILSALYDKAEYVRINGRLPFAENEAENEYDALPDYLVKTTIDKLRNNINKMSKRNLTTERAARMEKHKQNLEKLTERWHLLKPQI